MVLLAACDTGGAGWPTSRLAAPSQVRLSASIKADDATAVDVRVFYRRVSDDVDLARTVIPLPVTGGTPLTIDLAPCLHDVERAESEDGACPVGAELTLVRGDAELDRTVVGPVAARPGEDVLMPAATLYEVATIDIGVAAGGPLAAEPETTLVLKAIPKNKTGAQVAGRAAVWASSSPLIAAIDPSTGIVTTLAPGIATIAVTAGGRTAQVNFQVTPFAARRIVVSPHAVTVSVGASAPLAVSAFDRKNRPLAGKTAGWTSSNPGIADVSGGGSVAGVSTGAATVTATIDGTSDAATVTVTPGIVASVGISFASNSIAVGQTTQGSATPRDAAGNLLTGKVASNWRSSDVNVATVSATGGVTAVAIGATTISATVDGVSGSATVLVTSAPVASVRVALSVASIPVGQTVQATASPRDANDNEISAPVTWSTSNASVASVSPAGLVTGIAPGTTDITATAGNKTGTATLTVTPQSSATYAISTSASPAGTGSTSGGGVYASGAPATVTATAAMGFAFLNWTDGESVASSNATYQFTVTRDRTLVANFVPTFTLTVDSDGDEGGIVTSSPSGINCLSATLGHFCPATFRSGDRVDLTATTLRGTSFTGWSGDCAGVTPTCSIVMSQARTAVARFLFYRSPVLSPMTATFVSNTTTACPGATLYRLNVSYTDPAGAVVMNRSALTLSWSGSTLVSWADTWTGTSFSGQVSIDACVVFGPATSAGFILTMQNGAVSLFGPSIVSSPQLTKPSGSP